MQSCCVRRGGRSVRHRGVALGAGGAGACTGWLNSQLHIVGWARGLCCCWASGRVQGTLPYMTWHSDALHHETSPRWRGRIVSVHVVTSTAILLVAAAPVHTMLLLCACLDGFILWKTPGAQSFQGLILILLRYCSLPFHSQKCMARQALLSCSRTHAHSPLRHACPHNAREVVCHEARFMLHAACWCSACKASACTPLIRRPTGSCHHCACCWPSQNSCLLEYY